MTAPAIRIDDLQHAWPGGPPILDIPEFQLDAGESAFLAGPSGSGKSTLLGLIGGITPVQAGRVCVLGREMDPAKPALRDRIRADEIGMIFQLFNLVPYLSPVENVLLPLNFSAERRKLIAESGHSPREEARRILLALGLDDELIARAAARLSVGQQQRVAAARAIIGSPGVIVADEPTSALDEDSRDSFLDLLSKEARANGAALLFVSHERTLSSRFDRMLELENLNQLRQVA